MGTFKYAFILVATILLCVQAYKHNHLKVSRDSRKYFFIESFGFTTDGRFIMNMTDFSLHGNTAHVTSYDDWKDKIYFLVRITSIDSSEFLNEQIDYSCTQPALFTDLYVEQIQQNWSTVPGYAKTIDAEREGLWNLYFINCLHKEVTVSFDLSLEQHNLDANGQIDYLPIGLSPLPTIYGVFSAVYVAMFVVWIFGYMRGPGKSVNMIHYLMSILIVLKFFSLLFYAVEQHYVKITGVPGGWEIAYYIFVVLKTLFFFVIITLIGTGWSFFKPFLSERDKKIIMIVIPLQVVDNVAMVLVGASSPGAVGLITWKDIFRLVDIICCGAILIPIIWSIKHLREASQIDGKAARNLQKLRLFRQFYLIVVSYIYFTRIIVYLLDATLQYYLLYLGDVFTELATLCFFLVVGYKFSPSQGNPYFNLEEEDAARSEEMRAAEED